MREFKLNDQVNIPAMGFGTWQLQGEECVRSVEKALEVGYRHIDTADVYGNHHEVARAISNSGIPREDLFITSKVWRSNLNYDGVVSSLNRFLDELSTDYLDLLLIHWPNKDIPLEETLRAFSFLKEQNKIRSIGVSNFTVNHLREALQTGVKIDNDQVEFHPSFNQKDLKRFCDENGILLTAYSPIAQGRDLKLKVIQDLSRKYHRSESQVILSWLMSKNMAVIPRSSSINHISDNFKASDLTLSLEDTDLIEMLNLNKRLLSPPFAEFDH